jgi:hypothetical protein
MPLAVLLWILVLLPAATIAWIIFASVTEMDSDIAVQGVILLALALFIAAPNLLWYKSVRDVMAPEAAPVSLNIER